MIIGATHWFFAAGIAVAIHLAGVFWLSLPEPSPRTQETESVSDELVVTLGRHARATAELVEAAESTVGETVSTAAEPAPDVASESTVVEAPDAAAETIPEAQQSTVPESAPATLDLESADTADPVAAETAQAQPADAVSPEPESATAVEAEAPQPAASVSAEPGEAVGVETVDSAGESSSSVVEIEPAAATPSRVADDVAVPEAAAAPESAADVGAVEHPAVDDAGVESAEVAAAPGLAPAQEDIATVRPEETESTVETETVDAHPATDVDEVEVATARQPEMEVETTTSPDTVVETQPETIDLEELQDEAGGSGVVASYAGTLKGWLMENMHYPRAARLAGQEGKAVVRFVIDRDGRVQSITLESESGYPLLDREAQEMIERGDPFPEIPEKMTAEQLEVRVPVSFNIRDETLTKEIPPIYLE